jgi:hypothetical protein
MITTIIELIGGLIIVLRLLAPFIVKLAPKVWNYVTQRRRDNVALQEESSSMRLGKKIKRIFKIEGCYIFSLVKVTD